MPSTTRGNLFMIFLFAMFFIVPLVILRPILLAFPTMHYGLLLVLSQVSVFGITFVFYLIATKQNPLQVLRFAPLSFVNGVYIVVICILIQPIMTLLSVLVSFFAPNEISEITQSFSELPFWVTLLILAVTPAICEEITFRGVVLHEYQHASKKMIIVMNGIFFGLMHMNWNQFVYAALLGMIFSYFVLSTKSILSSMLGHFVINGGQAVLIYVAAWLTELSPEAAAKELEFTPDLWKAQLIFWGIASIIVAPIVLLLLREFHRYNKKRAFPLEIPESTMADCPIPSGDVPYESMRNEKPRWFFFTLIVVILLYASTTTYFLLHPKTLSASENASIAFGCVYLLPR